MSHLWRLISHRSQHSESTNRPPRHHAFRLEPWVQSCPTRSQPSASMRLPHGSPRASASAAPAPPPSAVTLPTRCARVASPTSDARPQRNRS